VIDASSPTVPVEIAALAVEGQAVTVSAEGQILLSANLGGGLSIISTANITDLQEIGHYPTTYSVYDVAVWEDYVFLAEGGAGLTVLDISNPATPTVVARLPETGIALGIVLQDQHAYVSDNRGRVHLVDVSNPAAPTLVSFYQTPGKSTEVALGNNYAYVISEGWGLFSAQGDLALVGKTVDHNDQPIPDAAIQASFGRTGQSGPDGTFTLESYLPTSVVVTPTLADRSFAPLTATLRLPQEEVPLRFVALPLPTSAVLYPSQAQTVVYTDVQGLATEIYFPVDSVNVTATVTITPFLGESASVDAFAGHAFSIRVMEGSSSSTHFSAPVSITIEYSDLDVRYIASEAAMHLDWGDSTSYVDAVTTCQPPSAYYRDVQSNTIALGVCQSGDFVLRGPVRRVHLPLVLASG